METAFGKVVKGGLARSEPTYEEWKPGRAEPAEADAKGSEPTYEEWKPVLARGGDTDSAVLSLPTRNGNQGRGSHIPATRRF